MREDGYWERRKKNNVSANRSRDALRLAPDAEKGDFS